MITTSNQIGKPASRVDGRLKVTGAAKYAGEFNVPDLAHGVVVTASIAKGRIKPVVDRLFPLGEAQAAHARMAGSAHIGKILLTP